jgi:hypothetical protein
VPLHGRVRGIDRDLIRGGHYGQRSYEPHTKAEHMALMSQGCAVAKKSLPTRSRPHMAQGCLRSGMRLRFASGCASDHLFS